MNIYQNSLHISPDSVTGVDKTQPAIDVEKAREAAKGFEAAYISQMLTFSGLDKALMSGGGEDMAAFASFYIESFADQITEKGGFGLADKFYERIIKLSELTQKTDTETMNVDFNKL